VLCPVRINERTRRCKALLVLLIAGKYFLFSDYRFAVASQHSPPKVELTGPFIQQPYVPS
jgi:hypothetical protein